MSPAGYLDRRLVGNRDDSLGDVASHRHSGCAAGHGRLSFNLDRNAIRPGLLLGFGIRFHPSEEVVS